MPFDSMVTNPGRLRILTALAAEPAQAFVQLKRQTGLTDGNLSTHARRLESAGFVAIEKSIASGKPLTTFRLTTLGRDALKAHAHSLVAALGAPMTFASAESSDVAVEESTDDWVD